jgi:hypothetical protein
MDGWVDGWMERERERERWWKKRYAVKMNVDGYGGDGRCCELIFESGLMIK